MSRTSISNDASASSGSAASLHTVQRYSWSPV